MQVIPALYITERLGYVISFCLREKLPIFKNTVYALPREKVYSWKNLIKEYIVIGMLMIW